MEDIGKPMVDLDAYCHRIGYSGTREPTRETLQALQALHLAAIPFEAIDVLLGRGVSLSPEAVDDKLIRRKRGGYCFEQNGLFLRVLAALGFKVTGLLARVLWMAPPNTLPRPRAHMVLRVDLDDEPWLVDVGFGTAVPPAPLRLAIAAPQKTPHDNYRLAKTGCEFVLEMEVGDVWQPAYQISLEPQFDIDYEVANWFTSTHPASHFRKNLVVSRTTPEYRAALLENRLTIRPRGGQTRREFLNVEQVEEALADVFGLRVEPDWRPVLERAVAAGESPGNVGENRGG